MEKDWWNKLYFFAFEWYQKRGWFFQGNCYEKKITAENLQVINLIINFFELVSFFTSSVSYEKSLAIHS